jgi:hypothetical protein
VWAACCFCAACCWCSFCCSDRHTRVRCEHVDWYHGAYVARVVLSPVRSLVRGGRRKSALSFFFTEYVHVRAYNFPQKHLRGTHTCERAETGIFSCPSSTPSTSRWGSWISRKNQILKFSPTCLFPCIARVIPRFRAEPPDCASEPPHLRGVALRPVLAVDNP